MARWKRGEAEVEALVAAGDLQKLTGDAPTASGSWRRQPSRWRPHGQPSSATRTQHSCLPTTLPVKR